MRLTCPHLRERTDPCPKQLPRQGQSFEPSPKLSSRFPGVCARKAISYDTRGAQACDACSTTTWVLVPQATRPSALTRGWLGLVKHKLAAVRHMASDFLFEGGRSNISSSTLPPFPPPSFPRSLHRSLPPPFLHRFFQLTFPDGGPLHLLPATHAIQGSRTVISRGGSIALFPHHLRNCGGCEQDIHWDLPAQAALHTRIHCLAIRALKRCKCWGGPRPRTPSSKYRYPGSNRRPSAC